MMRVISSRCRRAAPGGMRSSRSSRSGLAVALALALAAGACLDPDAGPEVLSGRVGLSVGLDLAARGLATTPAGINTSGRLVGSATDSINLDIGFLPGLRGDAAYQVWLVNEVSGDRRRIGFSHQVHRPDTIGVDEFTGRPIIQWLPEGTPTTVHSFAGRAGVRNVLVVRATDAAAAGAALPDYTLVVLTIGTAGDADPMSSTAPAFYRYRNPANNQYLLGGTANRVRFGFQPNAMPTPWNAFGGGNIAFLNVEGFGLIAVRVARPPLGFYYETWLIDDSGARAPVNLGPLTTPAPQFVSLEDADIEVSDQVTSTEILRAAKWVEWPRLGAMPDDFTEVLVVLRSKAGDPAELPPAVIFEALIPRGMDRLPAEREPRIRDY